MNKTQLIDVISEQADITKKQAHDALDAITQGIEQSLAQGEEVALLGFGSFKITERAARTGRNPRTGEPIQISASKSPTFKAGKALKDALNP
ncbi:HU family DNA-binding protein [Vibrio lentus]|uniref:DNA-binding protein HU n=2 Tax=Vibrio TaxID=662 RepID=A0AB36XJK7_9VIBR|nr:MULTISPECIES: HU family DNA-binding protein [Vibrio]MCC4835926.1 HU family DNA-binding protein [Vibrio lentus]MCW8346085.1 HU family DNA-binding protein [Vibrio qingdaonensis]MCY9829462.1 HU family DNA-binding protein [Vibrio chagasii]PMI10818.1 DNA-binding protein HU [Vibrio lentus]PMK35265.1 DNA-binding protein HU [Vibrio lentus]